MGSFHLPSIRWSDRPEPAWLDFTIAGPYVLGVLMAAVPWSAFRQPAVAGALVLPLVIMIAGFVQSARARRKAEMALSSESSAAWRALRVHVTQASPVESMHLLQAYERPARAASCTAWFPSTRLSTAVLLAIGILGLKHGIVGSPTPWAQSLFRIAVVLPWIPVVVVASRFSLDGGQLIVERLFALGLYRTVGDRVNLQESGTHVCYDRGLLVITSASREPRRIDLQFLAYPYRFFASVLHASQAAAGALR